MLYEQVSTEPALHVPQQQVATMTVQPVQVSVMNLATPPDTKPVVMMKRMPLNKQPGKQPAKSKKE